MNVVGKALIPKLADVASTAMKELPKAKGLATAAPSSHSMGMLSGLSSNNPNPASTNPFRNGTSARLRAQLPGAGGMAKNAFDTAASVASALPGPLGAAGTLAEAGLNKIESSKTDTLGAVANALGQGPAPSKTTASGDMDQAAMLDQATNAQQKNAAMTMKMSQLSQQADQVAAVASFLTKLNKNMCDALKGQ